MSQDEITASYLRRHREAKGRLAQALAEIGILERNFRDLIATLGVGEMANFDLRELPSAEQAIQLRDTVANAMREIKETRNQLAALGYQVE